MTEENKEIKNGTGHNKYEIQYEEQYEEQEKLTASERGFEPTENCY